jgi:O-antigen ligase
MIDQIIQVFYNLLFFVTPLIMTKSTSELFEFNKILFIYAVTVLIAFFWLLKMVVNKKIILKKTPLDIPIIVFFLSQLISTIFSLDRHTSIFGYYGRFNGGLLSSLSYIILYYAFVSNSLNVEKTLKAILTSSLLVILWAVPGKLGHDLTCLLFTGSFNNSCWDNTTMAFRPELRAFSTLGQPNWLGAYLAITFFIGAYFLIQKLEVKSQNLKSKLKSLIWPVYLFLNFSMILFSRSRSALFAVLAGLTLFIIYYLLFIRINAKKTLIILLIIIVIPIIFFKTGEDKVDKYLKFPITKFQETNKAPIINKQLPITSSNVTESFDIRKIVWQGAWDLNKKYPLFGTGVETFAFSYNFVRPASHNLTSEWDYVYNKAHNEYLNFLATTGFLGLGGYLCFIVAFIIYVIKKIKGVSVIPAKAGIQNKKAWIPSSEGMTISSPDILTLSLFCGWLTILITNFFGFSTTTIQLFFYLIPAFIIGLNNNLPITNYQLTINNLSVFQKLMIFLLLPSTIYLLFSITVYYLADVNYSYGTKYAKVVNHQKATSYFEKALKLRQEPVYGDRFSSSLAYLCALASLQNQKDLAKQIAALSDSYNRKTVQIYPKNVFYWKTRAKNMYYFYQMTGNDNELLQGIEALKTARNLYPTDPKIPYTLALYYSTLYDSSKNNIDRQNWQKLSLEEIDKTIKLKSNYREAYLFKGQLLKKYGQIDEAKKVFEYMLKSFNQNDTDVINEIKSL